MPVRPETDDIIEFLNSLVKLDPFAMSELSSIRVPCNDSLAGHESVQVMGNGPGPRYAEIPPGQFRLGLLGILNGYCGTIDEGPRKGHGPVTTIFQENRLLRFQRTEGVKVSQTEAAAAEPEEEENGIPEVL